jgi:glyoxylase I family protein
MLTKGAHHVSLTISDIAVSRRFYGDFLGLSEIDRPDFGIPGAWYQAGSVQLHLIQAPEGADVGTRAAKLTPLAGHLAFEIEDYDAVAAHLESAGLEVLGFGSDVGQMFVNDPDGNTLEFNRPRGS